MSIKTCIIQVLCKHVSCENYITFVFNYQNLVEGTVAVVAVR